MVAEDSIGLLRDLKTERDENGTPFFLWANFWGPHTPCFVPEPYYSMYDPASVPYEPSFTETWNRKPERQKLTERVWGLSGGGWPGWREIIARYWGYCTMLDDLTARILAGLDELGLADDTIVVFASDHGDMMGAHRLIEKGPFGYDESFRVPLVVRHPDCAAPGTTNDDFVCLHDLFATILDWAGCDLPDTDAVSFSEASRGNERREQREAVYGYSAHGLGDGSLRMFRTRRYKLTFAPTEVGRTRDLARDPWQLFELYDLVNDPYEMSNLIAFPGSDAQNQVLAQFRAEMVRLEDPMLDYFDAVVAAQEKRAAGTRGARRAE
jgi:arylsulfatase A-like enzyme